MRLASLPHRTGEAWPAFAAPPPSRRAAGHSQVSSLHPRLDLRAPRSATRRRRPYQEPRGGTTDGDHAVESSWASGEGVGHEGDLLPYSAYEGMERRSPTRSPGHEQPRRHLGHKGFARWRPLVAARGRAAREGNPTRWRRLTPESPAGEATQAKKTPPNRLGAAKKKWMQGNTGMPLDLGERIRATPLQIQAEWAWEYIFSLKE